MLFLVLLLDWALITDLVFDRERLDVNRLVLEYDSLGILNPIENRNKTEWSKGSREPRTPKLTPLIGMRELEPPITRVLKSSGLIGGPVSAAVRRMKLVRLLKRKAIVFP